MQAAGLQHRWVFRSDLAISFDEHRVTTPLNKDHDGYDAFRIRIRDAERIVKSGEKGLDGESLALAEQIRVISTERLLDCRSCTTATTACIELTLE
jgi:hypothetical protein